MKIIELPKGQPLAWYLDEEVRLAKDVQEELFFCWTVSPTVIYGRHQQRGRQSEGGGFGDAGRAAGAASARRFSSHAACVASVSSVFSVFSVRHKKILPVFFENASHW